MSKPKKQLNKRLIALLVAWILPGVPFLGGCYMVLQGATVNLAGIAVLLLLPLAFMLWIGHIIVSEESVFEKTVLTGLLWIAFFWIFMVSSMFVTFYTHIHRTEPQLPASYTEVRERFPALPEPEALAGFEKVTHYNYHLQQTVLFASDADTFIFYYEAGQYERQKPSWMCATPSGKSLSSPAIFPATLPPSWGIIASGWWTMPGRILPRSISPTS